MEFTESAPNRFVLPLANSIVERTVRDVLDIGFATGLSSEISDILISTVLPTIDGGTTEEETGSKYHPVVIKLVGASSALWLGVAKRMERGESGGDRTDEVANSLDDKVCG